MRKTLTIRTIVAFCMAMLLAFVSITAWADDKDFPPKPNPPRLVNDLAHILTDAEVAKLEAKLRDYNSTSSTEITIVTVRSIGEYDVSDYAIQLGERWGVGKKGKDNGVLILASINDRKGWVAVGRGLEGVLTDATAGQIFRKEMVPQFKHQNYYTGFDRAVDAVIAATKGEYKAEKEKKDFPVWALIIIVGFIAFFVWLMSKYGGGNNGGGGKYMSGRGAGDLATGWFLGSLMSGGGRGHSGGWGGSSSGGGFGGFGGGSFGGGGAGGSW